jgi:tetratricopeptide (TPR) repeat protein
MRTCSRDAASSKRRRVFSLSGKALSKTEFNCGPNRRRFTSSSPSAAVGGRPRRGLRHGLTEIPDGDELAFLIVQQFILTDRIDQAEAELENFPETAGGRTYRDTLAGLTAVQRRKLETARTTLQSVVDDGLDDNPFAENVRLQLARCCEALDDWTDATSIYEDILRRNPANETARLGLAVALLATGRHEEGVAEMKSLSHLEGVLRHFVLLEAETTARKPEEIRDWAPLQKFLEKKLSNVEPGEAAWLRALIAVAQRDLDTAKSELKSHGLEKSDSLFDLALVVYSNREVPLELLEKIVDAEPGDVAASSAVLAAWAQDDFQRVTDFVAARLAQLSRKERLLEQTEVASICHRAGELIEATIAERGSVPQLLDTRGCVRLALGENEEARLDFEMSVMLEPSPDAYFHLAVAELRLDNAEAARKTMRRAEERGFRPEFALPLESKLVNEVARSLSLLPSGEKVAAGRMRGCGMTIGSPKLDCPTPSPALRAPSPNSVRHGF